MAQGGKRTKVTGTKKATVSIITVVFNNVSKIEDTILSVLSQTSKDFEYIIIDGGSTDGTLDIIKKYEEQVDFWVSEKDKGIYDAMNKGLSNSKGEFVWFINSGDKISTGNTLEEIVRNGTDADIYYGETDFIDQKGKVLGTRTELTTRKLPVSLSWKDMKYGMVVSHQSIIVRKSIASEYNLTFKCSADIDWVISALKKSKKTVNTQITLSKYLIEGFSIINRKKCWKERFQVYVNHYGFLETCWIHVFILFRYALYKIFKKPNF